MKGMLGRDRISLYYKKSNFFLEKAYGLQKNRYLCSLEKVCQPPVCEGLGGDTKD